jgi:Saxitoxin biosynthesis operon protein SxtJ
MQTHESLDRRHDVAASTERGFGLVFAGVFAIVAGLRMWHGHSDSAWWLGAGTAFAIAALVRPAMLAPLNRAWARVGQLLHAIVNPVLMGLIFAVAIVPTGLALRLFGKDLLRLRRDPSAATYWVDRHESAPRPDAMKDQF